MIIIFYTLIINSKKLFYKYQKQKSDQFGVLSVECGVRSVEFGVGVQLGVRSWELGVGSGEL